MRPDAQSDQTMLTISFRIVTALHNVCLVRRRAKNRLKRTCPSMSELDLTYIISQDLGH
jgi:hypothetical protein